MSLCPHGKNLKHMKCVNCEITALAEGRLSERIKAAMPKPKPASFAPTGLTKRKEKDEEPVYDIRDLGLPPAQLKQIGQLIDIHAGITLEIKGKIRMKKQLAEQIKAICDRNNIVGKVYSGGTKLNYFMTVDKRITKESMLAQGYTPADIQAVTVSKDKWNLRITPEGAPEEDEDYG